MASFIALRALVIIAQCRLVALLAITLKFLVSHVHLRSRYLSANRSIAAELPHCLVSAFTAACWKLRRTSLASLFGKFERCTIRT